jgi:hemolysin-activating ACP:hemolysin acyltransferase
MLRHFTLGAGFLLLAVSAYLAFAGWPLSFILFALLPALALTLGVLYERTHYKAILDAVPAGNWRDTGERFVDPETKRVVAVYADPRSGKRIYVGQAPS